MKLSKTKELLVANICYHMVSSLFARYANPTFRGTNFSWEVFVEDCEQNAETWINCYLGDDFNAADLKPNSLVNQRAKLHASEIATTLVEKMNKG